MLKLFSPAKINLFLRVVGKRLDGYHELSSVFQTIDLGDDLYFDESHQDLLTCTDPSIPTDETNLIWKAVRLFRNKTGLTTKLKIHLDKKIPAQAGLGGGSGNAATTLWALNHMFGYQIAPEQLQKWSAEIGSDIPFFFSFGTAYCTGRGENVLPLDALTEKRPCLIVKPSIGLSTPEVYRRMGLISGPIPSHSTLADLDRFLKGEFRYFNDLERPAFEAKPELLSVKDALLKGGFETVLMTGSGSAFFCLGQGKIPADSSLTIYSTRFINRDKFQWYDKIQN